MVSLLEVTPSTLDSYQRGIGRLVQMYPQQWGVIFCADELLRSEMWSDIAEDLIDRGVFPELRPWDEVLRISTFGGAETTHAMTAWWNEHVVYPCQQASSPINFVQKVEGTRLLPLPGGMTFVGGADQAPPNKRGRSHNGSSNRNSHESPASSSFAPWSQPEAKGHGKHQKNQGKGHDKGNKGQDKGGKNKSHKGGKGSSKK